MVFGSTEVDMCNAIGLEDFVAWPNDQVGQESEHYELNAKGVTTVRLEVVKLWTNLFKDNRKASMMTPLHHFEQVNNHLLIEFDDIDLMEDALGYCLVGCFMGCS